MGDEPNLIDQFESSSNQGPTFYDYIEYGGKNQKDDKPVTYGTIKKPSTTSEFITSEIPFPNTSETSPSNANENQPTNAGENQPPIIKDLLISNEVTDIKKNDEKISDFLKDKNKYNNNNFNLCQNCKVKQNAFYCEICQKNLCRQCRDNNEICHHIVINLSNLELKAKEDKVDIYKMSYNLFFRYKQRESKEKSHKIYDVNDLNIDVFKTEIDDDINEFKYNDLKLIKRIIKANYINYFHYQNIFECKKYLANKTCFGKSCLVINYNIEEHMIGSEIQIFGDYFVKNNAHLFYLIINYNFSELISKTTIKDNYLEVILVKNSEDIITNLSYMFKNCIHLKNFEKFKDHDLIDFNYVEDISHMFEKCTQITELNLTLIGSFEKNKLKSMAYIFSECNHLREIVGMAKWKTKNVVTMANMFNRCSALINIDGIQNFDTSNVTKFSKMFCRCENLLRIPDIGRWNVSKAKELNGMFQECSHLVELPNISQWNTKNVTTMERMFYGCSALILLPDFSDWDMTEVDNIEEMFRGCRSITIFPDYRNWKNLKATVSDAGIFEDCDNYHN